LKKRLFKTMVDMGIEPGRYIVGNDLNSKNPVTGQPEFFFKKIFKRLKKAAGDISGYAAPIMGAMYGPAAGALVGAGLGAFKRENPGDPSQWAQMGMLGGGSGIAANLLGGASGMDLLKNTGLSQGLKDRSLSGLYDQYIGKDKMKNWKDYAKIFDPASPVTDGGGGSSKAINSIVQSMQDGELSVEQGTNAITSMLSEESKKSGLSISQLISIYGLGTLGLGAIIGATTDDQDVGQEVEPLPEGVAYDWHPQLTFAQGGVMDLQGGGESRGPGTGTSDSIPAMLSDGEFVMTADAVRGAGGGDRREGARKMYQLMENLESGGQLSRLSRGMEARA
jgi:hypothetical protein